MADKDSIIRHFTSQEDKEIVSKIYDRADRVFTEQRLEITNFLDPYQQDIAERIVNSFPDISAVFYGGFPSSERKKVGIFPKYWNITKSDLKIDVLTMSGNFKFDKLEHRDVLGALMNLGLKREKFGDIQIDDEILVAVDEDITDYIIQNLVRIGKVTVSVDITSEEVLETQEDHTKEINGTVSSLRLDAVAGVGFGASRSKMNQLIKAERVKLNWRPVTDPKTSVSEGDMISLRGKGRVEVSETGGESRKGRQHVILRQYK